MNNDLTVRPRGLAITSMDDLDRVADIFTRSGMFTDAKDAAQAAVKILAGQAWGIDSFTAMSGIYIVKNRPTISSGLMAAAVKGHPVYDYRVRERTAKACRIEFFERAESLGVSEYTMGMAERAGLSGGDTWRKHPEAMLFARAMSSGVRTFCPDVFGVSTYTPEELGAAVDDDGNIVDVVARSQASVERPALSAPVVESAPPEAVAPEPVQATAEASSAPAPTDKQKAAVRAAIKKQGLTKDTAREFFTWLFQRPVGSVDDFTRADASRVIGWDADNGDGWQNALFDYAEASAGGPPEEAGA